MEIITEKKKLPRMLHSVKDTDLHAKHPFCLTDEHHDIIEDEIVHRERQEYNVVSLDGIEAYDSDDDFFLNESSI